MAIYLFVIQLCLLAVQIGCIAYSERNNIPVNKVLGGFGFWAVVPITILMVMILIID